MVRLIFHIDVNSEFLSLEAVRRRYTRFLFQPLGKSLLGTAYSSVHSASPMAQQWGMLEIRRKKLMANILSYQTDHTIHYCVCRNIAFTYRMPISVYILKYDEVPVIAHSTTIIPELFQMCRKMLLQIHHKSSVHSRNESEETNTKVNVFRKHKLHLIDCIDRSHSHLPSFRAPMVSYGRSRF